MAKKITTEEFIERAKKVHGDKYDYSLSFCNGDKQNVEITCKEHGYTFTQRNDHHIRGSKCPKCSNVYRPTTEEFVKKAQSIHGDKYDYSLVKYKTAKENVVIVCDKHGEFIQTPDNHYKFGCNDCGRERVSEKNRIKIHEFIERAKKIHKNKYNYDKVEIKKGNDIIEIFCNKCKRIFLQSWRNHLIGSGCQACAFKNTSIEQFVEKILKDNKIEHRKNDRTLLGGMEIDFYLKKYNLAIECDGIHWHSEFRGKDKKYHLNKTNLCNDIGVRLIHIFENEINEKPKIVMSRLKNILNLNKYRIAARKCVVKEIDAKIKNLFLEKYHIQGSDKALIKLGMFYKNRIVAIMTFSKNRKALGKSHIEGEWELSRYATLANFSIVGGAGKLLKYFERNWAPQKITSYADLRWSEGNLYEKLGFTKIRRSQPNYWYFKGWKITLYHRFNFRKSELVKKLDNFNPDMTEWENMKENGWNRIWDCGNLVFEKN